MKAKIIKYLSIMIILLIVMLVCVGCKKEKNNVNQTIPTKDDFDVVSKIESDVYVYTKDEGGRHTPFYDGYIVKIIVGEEETYGRISLPKATEMVMPGTNFKPSIELNTKVKLEEGKSFTIVDIETEKTVGKGTIISIVKR